MNKSITLAFAVFLLNSPAIADVCDYRPSQLFGGAGAGALGAVGAGTAAAGLGAQAAGFYTLTHAVTGLTMLGSTAGGVSAAGTVGIMGGTAGLVGSIAAVILAPATIVAGAVLGAGVSIYEGACYFSVERVEDDAIILGILKNLAANSDEEFLKLTKIDDIDTLLISTKRDDNEKAIEWAHFAVSNLYIESGVLRHRDYGRNTVIGNVALINQSAPA
jgi:hypothetical protein